MSNLQIHFNEAWGSTSRQSLCEQTPLSEPNDSNIIYKGRNTLFRLSDDDGPIIVKAFQTKSLWAKASAALKGTKAERSFNIAIELQKRGIPTPEPLAWILDGNRSWYLCREAEGHEQIRAIQSDDDGLITALGAFVAQCHAVNVHHLDLTPGNILYRKPDKSTDTATFSLVDLNRIRLRKLSFSQRVGNLTQLEMFNENAEALLTGYAGVANEDLERLKAAYYPKQATRKWWRNIKSKTRPFRRRLMKPSNKKRES